MTLALDASALVAGHLAAAAAHVKVRQYLLRVLADPDNVVCLTTGILHELVHVVTDPRRFAHPLTMSEAIALARVWVGRSNVRVLPPEEADLVLALDRLERQGPDRKRIADTLLAATLLRQGVSTLVTCSPGDFGSFPELTLVDPRAAG